MSEVLFFGCKDVLGHFLYSKVRRVDIYKDTPWGPNLDTGLLRNKERNEPDKITGSMVVGRLEGWTAISFWDRSGPDNRGGCNSAFIIDQDVSGERLLELAKEQWPEIFQRWNGPELHIHPHNRKSDP